MVKNENKMVIFKNVIDTLIKRVRRNQGRENIEIKL